MGAWKKGEAADNASSAHAHLRDHHFSAFAVLMVLVGGAMLLVGEPTLVDAGKAAKGPSISNVRIVELYPTYFMASYDTDISAMGELCVGPKRDGTGPGGGCSGEADYSKTKHVQFMSLKPGMKQYYFIRAKIPADIFTQTRAAEIVAPPLLSNDATEPMCWYTSPVQSSTVSGYVSITLDCTDAGGVAEIRYYKNNTNYEYLVSDNSAPYSYPFDTRSVSNGALKFLVISRDNSGNFNHHSVSVNVYNAPAPLPPQPPISTSTATTTP